MAVTASGQKFRLDRLEVKVTEPVAILAAPGDTTDRLFVVSRGPGRVYIIKDGVKLSQPFISVADDQNSDGSGGLLGMAFHPNYNQNGRFYLSWATDTPEGDTVVAEFTVSATDPDVADPASRKDIFGPLPQTSQFHKAGDLAFGPGTLLYYSLGDGNPFGEPTDNRAQDPLDPRGSILRFDVDLPYPHIPPDNPFVGDPNGHDAIWAMGLRNPFRITIDRPSGDLYIADVGDSTWEEINFIPGGAPAPVNFGWRCMEGPDCSFTQPNFCEPCGHPGYSQAIYQYDHSTGGCSAIGGRVYRGDALPDMVGRYVFADFCAKGIYSFKEVGGVATDFKDHWVEMYSFNGAYTSPTCFGTDNAGELYAGAYYSDEVYKLVPWVPFVDLGNGLGGISGLPALEGDGTLQENTPITLTVSNGPPFAQAVFVLGLEVIDAPFKGGLLVPAPFSVTPGLPLDGGGSLAIPGTWPPGIPPGFKVYFQYWIPDPVGPLGFSASNALAAMTP